MSGGLISPLLWQLIPFGDPDSWEDFLGQHQAWHETLAKATGTGWQPVDLRMLGGPETEESAERLTRTALAINQQMHYDVADALGVVRDGDLVSYNLRERDEYVAWLWTHALSHERLRQVAGL
jgi:hypothetical protein